MKRFSLIFFTIILLFAVVGCSAENELSAAEVAALRSEYPICDEDPPMLSMEHPEFDELLTVSDTVLYAEILAVPEVFEKEISTGIPKLDELREENGISNLVSFYTYPVRVIEDTAGLFSKGDVIGLTANEIFEPYFPSFKPGDKIAVAIGQYEGDLYNYMADGVYYVTDDGYILSAFSEEGQTVRSGKHINSFMREFKNYKKKTK